MKKTFFIFLLFYFNFANSQEDNIFNLAISPSSPGFTILDLSPSDIKRPSDPNDFALILQNATENFSIIPKNYAIEIAPLMIFDPVRSVDELKSDRFEDVFKQTFTLSVATTTTEIDTTSEINIIPKTRLGFGLKFSIIRGGTPKPTDVYYEGLKALLISYKAKKKENEELKTLQKIFVEKKDSLKKDYDKKKEELEKKINNNEIDSVTYNAQKTQINDEYKSKNNKLFSDQEKLEDPIVNSIFDKIQEENKKQKDEEAEDEKDKGEKNLKEKTSKLEYVRSGIKLDVSAAVAYDFANDDYNQGQVSKIGAWLVFGGDFNVTAKRSNTFLTLLKYLNTPNVNDTVTCSCGQSYFRNSVSNIDFGARYISTWSSFSLSGEVLFRTESNQRPKNKYLIDLSYSTGDNKLIIFSFGKEFEGSPYRKGNLVAALNFLVGLGSSKPIPTEAEVKKEMNIK